mgnify:CR=1 FL=1
MKRKTKKLILELLHFWPMTIVVPIMLLSIMIVNGFKHDISSKVIGFGSHITISKHSNHLSYNSDSMDINQNFIKKINKTLQGII